MLCCTQFITAVIYPEYMETNELKFLLKLLGCPNYRSSLTASGFKDFKGKDKICQALSDRELEVLHHLAQGLSNRAIADKLFVTLAAIKWHARNIYGKLDVSNRTQAVARARELGILV